MVGEALDLSIFNASFEQSSSITVNQSKLFKGFLRARWAVHDRKKFTVFIQDITQLVTGLRHITESMAPLKRQDHVVESTIETMTDLPTLELISEACENDHPALSQLASSRSEALSLTSTPQRNIERLETVATNDDILIDEEIEDLTVTELKHRVLNMSLAMQELRQELSNTETTLEAFIRNVSADEVLRMLKQSPSALLSCLRVLQNRNSKGTGSKYILWMSKVPEEELDDGRWCSRGAHIASVCLFYEIIGRFDAIPLAVGTVRLFKFWDIDNPVRSDFPQMWEQHFVAFLQEPAENMKPSDFLLGADWLISARENQLLPEDERCRASCDIGSRRLEYDN